MPPTRSCKRLPDKVEAVVEENAAEGVTVTTAITETDVRTDAMNVETSVGMGKTDETIVGTTVGMIVEMIDAIVETIGGTIDEMIAETIAGTVTATVTVSEETIVDAIDHDHVLVEDEILLCPARQQSEERENQDGMKRLVQWKLLV